jgi:hypothetical protein
VVGGKKKKGKRKREEEEGREDTDVCDTMFTCDISINFACNSQ